MQETIVETVERTARKVCKRETQHFPEGASVGDGVRQGDVYITLLDRVPKGFVKQDTWDRQLAPGSTQGSRHILDAKAGVKYYRHPDANEFTGPVLMLSKTRELTHPEHGNWILPSRIFGISYQRTQDALDKQRRVAD